MAQQTSCKECGWVCRSCDDQGLLQLHVEVENLKQQLLERESHIRIMETSFLAEADKFPNGEAAALTEELLTWQDKYSRLYESYKRVQKVNQSLEDKLLRIVDKCETEKNDLLKEVSALTQRLIDARTKVNRLQTENDRYKNDVSLAIQLLQCKPANFVPQKYDSLPADLQQKVLAYVCGRRRPSDVGAVPIRVEMRTIKVPVSTSPPSSMLYPVNEAHSIKELSSDEGHEDEIELMSDTDVNYSEGRRPLDNVSAAIMAKVLEERERERQQTRHCESCTCFTNVAAVTVDSSTQTSVTDLEPNISCMNGYTATTRGSQGHVRFVDSLSRNISGNAQTNFPSRLGLKITENRNSKCDATLINIDSLPDVKAVRKTENVGSVIDMKNDNSSIKRELSNENHILSRERPLECSVCDTEEKEPDKMNLSYNSCISDSSNKFILEDILSREDGPDKLNSLQTKSSKEDCIIDLEVASDGRSDVPKANRGKELSIARNSGEVSNKSTSNLQRVSGSQSFSLKVGNREARNLGSSESGGTARSPSNWIRYPSDASKKSTLVVSSDKTVVPSVRPSETSVSRVSFPSVSLRGSNRGSENSPGSGPRFCSMRLQAGTSNILLDNATSYEPVLYTSRHTQDGVESWGVSASRSGAAVLVHAPRSRAPSLDEAPTQNKVALWVHANPTQTGT
ncbi:hypothetical protein R5R35_007835 [Gryllus longicercus]|uniref:Brain-enriched guanylate kinase-associated protein n=1 Tax=Gryllus longicercus TaxID=2509291 RepID=A0AAN9W187_9ORTH